MATKFLTCLKACEGRSPAYVGGYVDAAFGNEFRPGKEVGSHFLSYAAGGLDYSDYKEGYEAAREIYSV